MKALIHSKENIAINKFVTEKLFEKRNFDVKFEDSWDLSNIKSRIWEVKPDFFVTHCHDRRGNYFPIIDLLIQVKESLPNCIIVLTIDEAEDLFTYKRELFDIYTFDYLIHSNLSQLLPCYYKSIVMGYNQRYERLIPSGNPYEFPPSVEWTRFENTIKFKPEDKYCTICRRYTEHDKCMCSICDSPIDEKEFHYSAMKFSMPYCNEHKRKILSKLELGLNFRSELFFELVSRRLRVSLDCGDTQIAILGEKYIRGVELVDFIGSEESKFEESEFQNALDNLRTMPGFLKIPVSFSREGLVKICNLIVYFINRNNKEAPTGEEI